MTWFNPPFSRNVKTNIGRKFLGLIDKHFPPNNKISKIFNCNTIKVSYSCMTNTRSIISQHNARILSKRRQIQATQSTESNCNCREKANCPLQGNCLTKSLVYQAEVTVDDGSSNMKYIGMTADTFKKRYGNHSKSFRNQRYASETVLSRHVWEFKQQNKPFSIKWSILKRAKACESGGKRCNLCLTEKMCIFNAEKQNLLNKRTELFAKCRHRVKSLLKNIA